jgi:hypothetical protein
VTWTGAGYCCAVELAAVFVIAAVAKLRDRNRVAEQFAAMRLRQPVLLAEALPWTELVVAGLLVAAPQIGADLAVVAVGAMTIVLVRLVRSGTAAPCACFGSASSAPVSSVDVARNGVLLVMAVVALGAERAVPSAADVVVVGSASLLAALGLAWARRIRR